jgi:hypothetical protein
MRIASPDNRLFRAFGNWVIRRAMRTPYIHLFHDDGRPYMERFWLFRLGKSRSNESGECYPWFGMRVHHIQSGDDRVFHDHPWNFATLILRGSYKETVPLTPRGEFCVTTWHQAGTLRLVRASQWHYLSFQENPEVLTGREAWTLFITSPKRQSWGFLVDGVKVPWRQYLAQRAGAKGAATP